MYYSILTYYDLVKSKSIKPRCPNCGQLNCLELFFYQKRIETVFTLKVTKKVSGILYCNNTKTEISPVLWTEEIEYTFNTEKQRLKLNPKSFKLSKWSYIILFLLLVFMLCIRWL